MRRLLNQRYFPDNCLIAAMDARIPEIEALIREW